MGYKFLEDIAIADVAFEASGKDLNELFESCAEATSKEMADLDTINPKIEKKIKIEENEIDNLLFAFIEELIYLKDSQQLIFKKFKVSVKKGKSKYKLEASVFGEKINPKKHKLGQDVKAITYHLFEVKKEKNKWKARIILDI